MFVINKQTNIATFIYNRYGNILKQMCTVLKSTTVQKTYVRITMTQY